MTDTARLGPPSADADSVRPDELSAADCGSASALFRMWLRLGRKSRTAKALVWALRPNSSIVSVTPMKAGSDTSGADTCAMAEAEVSRTESNRTLRMRFS